MRVLSCLRPQETKKQKDELSPAQIKTHVQSAKIDKTPKEGFLSRLFSRKRDEEKVGLTETRV